ncbi:CRISPR-associated endonuclease Cas4g/Cas1g [Yunchengibacter salinarum]|uniref:CRISPR-associated endonuclease Cas4g/Cas1g n=1 Tax=Yunchengibacter salinarum TaxID=3133399 RepID=UPI0035B6A2D6
MPRHPHQHTLPLPAPPAPQDTPLVPVRMVNEWVYCPRLAWLEWVEGEWADSGDTAEGRRVHTRVDRQEGALPQAQDLTPEDGLKTRALTLSSEKLGIIARIDLLEAKDGRVTPVDYKKGKRPHVEKGAYEPERVQVCAQALILEDSGYTVTEGALWFAGSRERVPVHLDEDLRTRTLTAISDLRLAAAAGRRPPPLEASRKCVSCSLAGICMPDETNFFRRNHVPRPLNPSDDPALPLYVQTPGARIRKDGETLLITTDDTKTRAPIIGISELVLMGPVSLTTPTLHALLRQDIPVTWASGGGWVLGHTVNTGSKNVDLRTNQYKASFDDRRCLAIARGLVAAKIQNSRTQLRRNWKDKTRRNDRDHALDRLKRLVDRSHHAPETATLLGLEGEAAAIYFQHFEQMLAPGKSGFPAFAFHKRNRRPPADPMNALLSFAYALLTRTWHTTLSAVGFDPYRGFYHRPRHGRPALALDMMEPFRPILSDSVVIQAINNGEIQPDGFTIRGTGCTMKPATKKALIAAYERRLSQETTHPVFGYRLSMRRLIEVQARLLGRYLDGELSQYPHYLPR